VQPASNFSNRILQDLCRKCLMIFYFNNNKYSHGCLSKMKANNLHIVKLMPPPPRHLSSLKSRMCYYLLGVYLHRLSWQKLSLNTCLRCCHMYTTEISPSLHCKGVESEQLIILTTKLLNLGISRTTLLASSAQWYIITIVSHGISALNYRHPHS